MDASFTLTPKQIVPATFRTYLHSTLSLFVPALGAEWFAIRENHIVEDAVKSHQFICWKASVLVMTTKHRHHVLCEV